ncbi:MAG: DUF433 domain-containing protein [Acidobacteria bacterium]|nr:DUF433 domain-containing protein [Acidobacteriota bacterium]
MAKDYVEYRDGQHYLLGSRVPLYLIAVAYTEGTTPEEICSSYPSLNLEKIFGAIAFFLANKATIQAEIAQSHLDRQAFLASHPSYPDLKAKLAAFRLESSSKF